MEVTVDTLINIYYLNEQREIGTRSPYINEEHPGSNKKIEGWKWDKRIWPTTKEFDGVSYVPTVWDPSISLDQDYFQSGYGDGNALLLLGITDIQTSGSHIWTPKIHNGQFFVYDEEWILFSDFYQQEYFTAANVVSGQQYLDMRYQFKPSSPLQVRRYNFNTQLGRHFVEDDFRKKVEFTTSSTDLEFCVDQDYDPPRIWLNGEYSTEIGHTVSTPSGVPDAADILDLELVGISDGTAEQQFYLDFSPVDPSQNIEVWIWKGAATTAEQWELVSGVEPFVSSGLQVKIDRDHGILSFGNWDASEETGGGKIPSSGSLIGITYTKGLVLNYEPYFGKDYIFARTANTNPVAGFTSHGFVQILTQSADPVSLTLEAELGTNVLGEYLIDLGNNTGRLIATVYDAAQRTLEGEEVTFEILAPTVGSFGALRYEISALSNSYGQARTVYNAPTTIEDMGQVTNSITIADGNTIIEVEGITDPGTVSGLYLYKVHEWDPPLGIPATQLSDYYSEFFDEEGITEGATATELWESQHRTINNLNTPVTYDAISDLKTGKKTIILTQGRSNVVDPRTGEFSTTAFAPLYATTIESIGTQEVPALRLTYSGIELPEIGSPADDRTKAYFVIGDAKTRVRAYVTNRRTKKKIYSNTISVHVTIPEAVNGTYFANVLSSVPSGLLYNTVDVDILTDEQINTTSGVGTYYIDYLEEQESSEDYVTWFRRTRRGDTAGMAEAGIGFEEVQIDSGILSSAGEIPLGFRLKSTGIMLASVLDQITYLDPNDNLPSGYFGL